MSHPLAGRITFNDRRTAKPRVLEAPYKLEDPYVAFAERARSGLWGYAASLASPCPTPQEQEEMEAMKLILELLRRGLARFSHDRPGGFTDFWFDGKLRIFHHTDTYTALVKCLDREKIQQFLHY